MLLLALFYMVLSVFISCGGPDRLGYDKAYDLSRVDFGMDVHDFFCNGDEANVFDSQGARRPFTKGMPIDVYIDTLTFSERERSAFDEIEDSQEMNNSEVVCYSMMGYSLQKAIAVYKGVRFPRMTMLAGTDGRLMAVAAALGGSDDMLEVIGGKQDDPSFSFERGVRGERYYMWEEEDAVVKAALIPDETTRTRPYEKTDGQGNILEPGIIDKEVVQVEAYMYVLRKDCARDVAEHTSSGDFMYCR